MKVMRIPVMVVMVSAVAKIVVLGAVWQASADAAGLTLPTWTPPVSTPQAAERPECAPDARGFRELLETVRKRAEDVERRETDVKAREAGLAAMRKAVTSEITRLEDVAKALGITLAPGTGVAITKIYETMRAEDAAPILDRLDDATLRVLLGRMREKQVGAILAAMNRERAVAVTKVLAGPALAAATPSAPRPAP